MNLEKFINKVLISGIYVLIVAIPLIIDTSSFSYKLLFMQLLVGFLLIILSIKFLIRDSKIHFSILLLPVILYLIAIIYSYIISDYKEISIFVLSKKITFLSIFFLIGFTLKSTKALKRLINVWIFTATIVAMYGILQYFGLDFLNLYKEWFGGYYRIFSTVGNPNFLAGYLAIMFPFLISNFLCNERKFIKLIISVSGLMSVSCIILTFSRGGYLVFFISVVNFISLLFLWKNKGSNRSLFLNKKFLNFVISIIIIILAFIIIFYVNPDLKQKLISIFTQRTEGESSMFFRRTARIYIWQGAIEMVKVKALTGFGLGTFVINFPTYKPDLLRYFHPTQVAYVKHAHNQFLEVWIESGLGGIISFLILIFAFLVAGIKYIRMRTLSYSKALLQISALSSFIGILFMNLVNVNMHYPVGGMYFWILAGIICLMISRVPKLKRESFFYFRIIFSILLIIISLIIFKTIVNYSCCFKKKVQNFNLVFLSSETTKTNLEELKKKVETQNLSPQEYNELGLYYARQKNWSQAINFFYKAIDKKNDFIIGYNNLANSYFYNGSLKEAIKTYQLAIKLDNKDKDIFYYNMGIVYFSQGLLRETIENMIKAININPKNCKAKFLIYTLAR